ncbi:hypothetical protein GCM10011503_31730 [Henriciella pelagia]|uniref:Uncharacterized protein n=1 Tax=Henriciella pelagia TaxID=1977912 RepID=A0ABQ1JYK0_9PROT|nr:hypothetical protein GCM10011503_31730 [Henriciella pelagia]
MWPPFDPAEALILTEFGRALLLRSCQLVAPSPLILSVSEDGALMMRRRIRLPVRTILLALKAWGETHVLEAG